MNVILIIFIRTLLIYALLLSVLRLMGKRQLGELELSELITTLLISELATLPIEDPSRPLLHAVVPILTIGILEILTSLLLIRVPRLKALVSVRPAYLIRQGKIDFREMKRSRISFDELISSLRQNQAYDVSQVNYAILESNGTLTVQLMAPYRTPNCQDLGLKPAENGIARILVSDGRPDRHNLQLLGYDEAWLHAELKRQGHTLEETLLFLVDDSGSQTLIPRSDSINA
jgi:uncharacterized membrane protein YcaP (DUF421 family)